MSLFDSMPSKAPEFGRRLTIPQNLEINTDGGFSDYTRKVAIRMVEQYDDAVINEIVKEARISGFTDVTVLNKKTIMAALKRYFSANDPVSVEGHKAFRGTMRITPNAAVPAFELRGDWLYKPDTGCWYGKGSSFAEDICTIVEVE